MTEKAISKLEKEYKDCKKLSQKGNAVKEEVLDALKFFCRQNSEFAQAVVQTKAPLKDCIEGTVKDCGNKISDIDVYKAAVRFYFPGADIRVVMTIDLGDSGFSNNVQEDTTAVSEEKKPNSLHLSLDDLGIDW